MKRLIGLLIHLLAFSLICCVSSEKSEQQIVSSEPLLTSNNGKEISLGISVPKSQGLSQDQDYLPVLVQGVLVDTMKKYSEISVLDRVSLDRVISETLDPTFEDNLDIVRLGHVAQVGNWLTGNIIKTSTGYNLLLNITDTTPNAKTVASYNGTCTVKEFEDYSAIHKASLSLLDQMGIELTQKAKNELGKASAPQYIVAQTALSQGIIAQHSGNTVETMAKFYEAATYDPSLYEAVFRANTLSENVRMANIQTAANIRTAANIQTATISTGNIGDDIRNKIAQYDERIRIENELREEQIRAENELREEQIRAENERVRIDNELKNEWAKILSDAEKYIQKYIADFNQHIEDVSKQIADSRPLLARIVYDPTLKHTKIDYANRTADFTFKVYFAGAQLPSLPTIDYPKDPPYRRMIADINEGLKNTKRNESWKLKYLSVPNTPERVCFYFPFGHFINLNKTISIDFEAELLNDTGQIISKINKPKITRSGDFPDSGLQDKQELTFTVKADDITDPMAIRINKITANDIFTGYTFYYSAYSDQNKASTNRNRINCSFEVSTEEEFLAQIKASGVPPMPKENINIKRYGKLISSLTVETPQNIYANRFGLAYRPALINGEGFYSIWDFIGIIFEGYASSIYPTSEFSNYNFPIDVAFVDQNQRPRSFDYTKTKIVAIVSVEPGAVIQAPKKYWNRVLVVPKGWFKQNKVRVGDIVE